MPKLRNGPFDLLRQMYTNVDNVKWDYIIYILFVCLYSPLLFPYLF